MCGSGWRAACGSAQALSDAPGMRRGQTEHVWLAKSNSSPARKRVAKDSHVWLRTAGPQQVGFERLVHIFGFYVNVGISFVDRV